MSELGELGGIPLGGHSVAVADISDRRSIALRALRAGDPVLWLIVAAAFAAYTALSVSRYVTGNPASWDLAIFTEAVKQYAHLRAPIVSIKGPGFNVLGDHFSPIVAVLAPAFQLFPSPVTLLAVQAALTAVSVIPVYRAARHLLTTTEARLVAAAYGLSWGLAEMVWSDFHEVAFAVPLLACSLSALVRRQYRAAACWALPLVLVKEDQGFTVAAIGLVLAVVYRKRLAGLFLTAWGAGWSLLAVYVLIPAFNPNHQYPYWRDGGHLHDLTAGLGVKLPTLAVIFLPTVFAALRSPLAAATLPGLALRFHSSNHAYWGTALHYNATAMPIVFLAAVDGLARMRATRMSGQAAPLSMWLGLHAPAMMASVAVTFAFVSPLSSLWQASTFKVPPRMVAAQVAERLIPSGATVVASVDELATLAARDDVYWWGSIAPQWILFDRSSFEQKTTPEAVARRYPGVSFRLVYQRDGIWLYQQVSSQVRRDG